MGRLTTLEPRRTQPTEGKMLASDFLSPLYSQVARKHVLGRRKVPTGGTCLAPQCHRQPCFWFPAA